MSNTLTKKIVDFLNVLGEWDNRYSSLFRFNKFKGNIIEIGIYNENDKLICNIHPGIIFTKSGDDGIWVDLINHAQNLIEYSETLI